MSFTAINLNNLFKVEQTLLNKFAYFYQTTMFWLI